MNIADSGVIIGIADPPDHIALYQNMKYCQNLTSEYLSISIETSVRNKCFVAYGGFYTY
jgi:hypothetical protein